MMTEGLLCRAGGREMGGNLCSDAFRRILLQRNAVFKAAISQ